MADMREARVLYLMREIGTLMKEPLGQDFVDKHLSHLPPELHYLLPNIPRFICVTKRGGRNAEHVLAIYATVEQWENNFALKDDIAHRTGVAAEESRDIGDLLKSRGAGCLADMINGAARR